MNPDRWYYAEEGKAIGPLLLSGLRQRAERGLLGSDSMVWQEGMAAWVPAGSVESLLHVAAHGSASVHYAGFWRRVAASIIDNLLMAGVGLGIGVGKGILEALLGPGFPGSGAFDLSAMAVAWVYHIGMECSPLQATLGKRVLGVWVSDLQWPGIDLGRE